MNAVAPNLPSYDPDKGYSAALYSDELGSTYDPIYTSRRDFTRECADLRAVVAARHQAPQRWLDVGCGTGEHLRHLAQHVQVTGMEKSPAMLAIARRKNPQISIVEADMHTMDLQQTFDVITCLYATLAYCPDPESLAATLSTIASHLNPGGLLVLDPWWSPDTFIEGYVSETTVHDGDRSIVRVSHSTRQQRTVLQTAHFLIAAPDVGISHHRDVQRLTLFTQDEYESAIVSSGCTPTTLPPTAAISQFPRGLFIGRRADSASPTQ